MSVNALSRAVSISTTWYWLGDGENTRGVNALSRAVSISTKTQIYLAMDILMCQCPQSGCLHFYKKSNRILSLYLKCVNALSRAVSISTMSTYRKYKLYEARVNALSRAVSISTRLKKEGKCP